MKTHALISTAIIALLVGLRPDATAGTTVNFGTFSDVTGPGSLDLAGNILYAVCFNQELGDQTVNGVTFVNDGAPPPGFSSVGTQNVINWQTKPEFGATADDDALEEIYSDIRWTSQTPPNGFDPPLQANMDVTPGLLYRVQILFYGNHVADARGWDIQVEGVNTVDNISSLGVDTGAGPPAYSPNIGLVYTYDFTAPDNQVNVSMGQLFGAANEQPDFNAIWSGITLERLVPPTDSDADGLPDTWELQYFPNLNQSGTGDPDSDGLTNTQEFTNSTDPVDNDTDNDGLTDGVEVNTHGTNPRQPDSDNDGLTDGAEINTHHTDPKDRDSDNDTLTDGAEVTTHLTNPASIDSDGDGFNDPTELISASNPNASASTPGATYIARVIGADPVEGLDLTGTFPYAFNVGPNGGVGLIHDANFTSDFEPGIVVSAPNQIPDWANPDFGAGAADAALNLVFQDIRWADLGNANPDMQNVKVDLANLTPGKQYKLQLLFGEQCCPLRTFDVYVEGTLIADEFNIATAQGSTPMTGAGAAVVFTFTATDSTLNIVLDGATAIFFPNIDQNATLSGVTLEEITAAMPLEITSVSRTATTFTINSRGTPGRTYSVDHSADLVTWGEAWDSLVPNAAGNATWTDTDAARVGTAIRRGFYKVRDPVLDPTP